MANERLESGLDMIHRRKLSDLAYREGVSDAETLRRLIDRAYESDLRVHLDTYGKPGTPAPPPG